MTALDERLLRVTFEIEGQLYVYENLAITAKGTKSGSFLQNECEITIANLDKATRDFLLTAGSPQNRLTNRKRVGVTVEAGRKSIGYFIIYQGDISTVQVTQPPDIILVVKALTAQHQKGNIVTKSMPPMSNVSAIAQSIADDLGVSLNFQATDKQINNYNFAGAAEKQIQKIYSYGDFDAYVDDGQLVVLDKAVPLINSKRLLNLDTGLLFIPEFIDYGVRVTFFVDNQTKVGTELEVESLVYPTSSGTYSIYKLQFDIANRDTPFYYIAEARRLANG